MQPLDELRRADAHHQQRKYQEAIDGYRRAIDGDAALYEAWYGLGCAKLSLRAYRDAADALQRTIALRPDATGARCNLAEALFQLGDIDAAIAQYHTVANTGDAELRAIALAGIGLHRSRWPGAEQCQHSGSAAALDRTGNTWHSRIAAGGESAGQEAADRLSQRVLRRAQLDEALHGCHQRA